MHETRVVAMAKGAATEGHWLHQIIGENLRRWREDHGHTQDEVAALARAVGLSWTQATVAQIETGRRETLERLSELMLVSEFTDLSVGEMVASDSPVELASATNADPEWIRAKLQGKHAEGLRTPADLIYGGTEFLESQWPGEPTWKAVQAATDSLRTAEQRAAASLGVEPFFLSREAWKRWGRGLTEERDRRAREEYPDGVNAQALGRITRNLIAELRKDNEIVSTRAEVEREAE